MDGVFCDLGWDLKLVRKGRRKLKHIFRVVGYLCVSDWNVGRSVLFCVMFCL